jgi:uncharacterized membrane protein YgcG
MSETSDGIARTSGASENRQEGGSGDRPHQQGQGNRNRNKNKNAQVRASKFKGDCEALEAKGAVYVIGSQDYNQTTRNIAEYIAKTYQNAKDFRIGLVERVFPAIEPPDRPQDTNNIFEVEDWKLAHKRWFEKTKEREENMGRAFPLILGQCEKPLQDRMMANSDWEDISRNHDVIGLLNLIQVCMHGRESGRYPTHTRMDADERFFKFYQKDLSDTVYYERFKDIVDQCKLEGSKLGLCDKDIRAHLDENAADPDNPTAEETRQAEDACRSAYYAVAFIWHADQRRFGELKNKLRTDYSLGKDVYPKTLHKAFEVLCIYSSDTARKQPRVNHEESGIAFTQNSQSGEGDDRGDRGNTQGGRGSGGRGGNSGRGGRGPGGRGGNGGRGNSNRENESQFLNDSSEEPNGNNNSVSPYLPTASTSSSTSSNDVAQLDTRRVETAFQQSNGPIPRDWLFF